MPMNGPLTDGDLAAIEHDAGLMPREGFLCGSEDAGSACGFDGVDYGSDDFGCLHALTASQAEAMVRIGPAAKRLISEIKRTREVNRKNAEVMESFFQWLMTVGAGIKFYTPLND